MAMYRSLFNRRDRYGTGASGGGIAMEIGIAVSAGAGRDRGRGCLLWIVLLIVNSFWSHLPKTVHDHGLPKSRQGLRGRAELAGGPSPLGTSVLGGAGGMARRSVSTDPYRCYWRTAVGACSQTAPALGACGRDCSVPAAARALATASRRPHESRPSHAWPPSLPASARSNRNDGASVLLARHRWNIDAVIPGARTAPRPLGCATGGTTGAAGAREAELVTSRETGLVGAGLG